ncbi:hypothetical protein ASG25_21535 [Rhizobium sp. Leaf384]|uniref:hypothetical protein n=1 Tax=Rhizobium sp. Leaf384 TaxID=1736358 RepID=UPI000714D700|nr:hypothetical protein [Rhizobium sp. Leaf384]KQS74057.1 hypothetical protein ASG25_21535 [Rhizobium sp. Leaf384]
MTPEEKRWSNRLRRVLRDMPASIEIQIHQSHVDICQLGAIQEAFSKRGDVDNVETLDWFQTERVYPCSESL